MPNHPTVHTYPDLLLGKLVKRYKRFFADIELDSGETIVAHCANTGPMTGVCEIGAQVAVFYNPSPKRKLAYSWEMIHIDGVWAGINTSLPNKAIGYMLENHLLPELEPYDTIQPEVAYGEEKSRIDYLLDRKPLLNTQADSQKQRTYVEIKNTTWCDRNIALFPDTVTTRGQKHLRELMSVVNGDSLAAIIYFINRGDCDQFKSGDRADPEYGKLLREAIACGVKVLPCRFHVTPQTITYLGLAELVLD
ncbi:DNA/RNA nuclease SfsA [Tumidithrix elongata RA019]|uniref:Sugar fermentation stimulation protein homolog n=1 Tax=Tumidithrix elongata BACA0141 TaxID=2716417 RepID=A0AAW9PYY7_9CYAN|nr:DNA/RNA nuclease SfsA [Tumidithrix elongata RA019]